jgi:RES domain-containing protein
VAHGIRTTGLTRATTALYLRLSVYRVARAIHPLFDGRGAARFGARWTSPGRLAIYAAGSYAGALLEILVHARRLDLKVEYRCAVIDIPKRIQILKVSPGRVRGWDADDYVASRAVGDRWLDEGKSAVLCVPSMTGRPHELNYIVNPEHADARKLTVHKPHAVMWDDRLR